jgi:hypothetical protein
MTCPRCAGPWYAGASFWPKVLRFHFAGRLCLGCGYREVDRPPGWTLWL